MITKINAAAGRPLVPNLGPSEFRFYELDPIEEGFEADDLFDENIPRKLGRPGSRRKFKNWKRKNGQKSNILDIRICSYQFFFEIWIIGRNIVLSYLVELEN